MSLFKTLELESTYKKFYEERENFLSKKERKILLNFVNEEKYRNILETIQRGTFFDVIPKKVSLNKSKISKKRDVFIFPQNENIMLKVIASTLHKYDYLLSKDVYSYRRDRGMKHANMFIRRNKAIHQMYGCKIDIKSYFNNIKIELAMNILERFIEKDEVLFLKRLYEKEHYIYDDEINIGEVGAYPGMAISSFIANFYLYDFDMYFKNNNIIYFRYADDILFFSTKDNISKIYEEVAMLLKNHGLKMNEEKTALIQPRDPFVFLGIEYNNGICNISFHSVAKIKRKIRYHARRIANYNYKKPLTMEDRIQKYINRINKILFIGENKEYSWTTWYFPYINQTNRLKEIDQYFQKYCRYFYKKRIRDKDRQIIDYSLLKKLGYKSLVHEYYTFIKQK